jgi:hypothetical protein
LASRFAPWATAWALSLAAALPAAAQTPNPAGAEFQVNSFTTNYQTTPSVATEVDGDFVVVWSSYGSSGTDHSGTSIQGQRYASDGSTRGAQFQLNSYATGNQRFPTIAAESDGDFVVTWSSAGSAETDADGFSIQAQRFASDGSTLGTQFQVNTYTTTNQTFPAVAAGAAGEFVVAWVGYGSAGTDTSQTSIHAQRHASDGSPLGAEFQVNTRTSSFQRTPWVASDPDGDFVVVWRSLGSFGTDTSGESVQGQRYASDGSALGTEFQVNSYTTGDQVAPSVAVGISGEFLVVWESAGSSGTDVSGASIQGQRYASDGSAQGAEFQINSFETSDQRDPAVTSDADGNLAVVWQSDGSSGTDTSSLSIQGQRLAPGGSPLGAEIQVNTYTSSEQRAPAVSAAANGEFVVVWRSQGSSGTDTSSFSVQGQRYRLPFPVPALSLATRFALGALMLLGVGYALRKRA